MTPSNLSCTTRTRQLSNQAEPSSATLGTSSFERKEEHDGHTLSHHPRDGTRRARPHTLKRSGRHWRCEACGKHASGGAARAKLARTACTGHPPTTLGEQARPHCHLLAQTGSFCVAAGVEREQPSSQRSLASRVWSNQDLKNMHEAYACHRAGGIPRNTVFLDRRSCSQRKHGGCGGKATKGTTATELRAQASSGSASLGRCATDGPR